MDNGEDRQPAHCPHSPSSRLAEQPLKCKAKTIHCLFTGTGNLGWLAALGPFLWGQGTLAAAFVLGLGMEPPPAREARVEARSVCPGAWGRGASQEKESWTPQSHRAWPDQLHLSLCALQTAPGWRASPSSPRLHPRPELPALIRLCIRLLLGFYLKIRSCFL